MQYAQFDPEAAAPHAVIGWYDTQVFNYPNLPAGNALVPVTAAQWAAHFDNPNGWTVDSGQLISPND